MGVWRVYGGRRGEGVVVGISGGEFDVGEGEEFWGEARSGHSAVVWEGEDDGVRSVMLEGIIY